MPPTNPALAGIANNPSDLAAVLHAGVAFGEKQSEVLYIPGLEGEEDGKPFAFLGGQAVDLSKFMPPRLGKMSPSFQDATSLVAYVKKYKNDDTLIFVDFQEDGGKFTVVFDYPGVGKVSRKEHVATFDVETTPEWDALLGINKRDLNQDSFCAFVEQWDHLFAKPNGTDMLEMARYIEGRKEGQFTFGKRLSNGDREILWKEQTQINAGATGGGDPTPVPERITFRLALFEGTEPIEIETFLRVHVSGGKVAFKVEIRYIERIVRAALIEMRNTIRDDTGVTILLGRVGSPALD